MRDVVVDDVADALDVETTRGDVGGDENVERTVLELVDRALALGLHDVAVDRGRGETAGAQPLGQILGGLLRAHEDDHRLEGLDLEDTGQRVELALVGDEDPPLGDVRRRRRLRLDGDFLRILEVLLRQPADRARHGRGEQRDLLGVGGVGEDALDVLLEAHGEHLVGLVEDEELELGDVEGALAR